MAYDKQTWVSGEVITAAKLNHMEDGIASGGLTVTEVTALNANEETFATNSVSGVSGWSYWGDGGSTEVNISDYDFDFVIVTGYGIRTPSVSGLNITGVGFVGVPIFLGIPYGSSSVTIGAENIELNLLLVKVG